MRAISKRARLLGASAALAAGLAMQPAAAQPVEVSGNGKGSAVFVPYYTVNDGFSTLLNITNTGGTHLVIKVRLHEARNSRDVLDFNVALTPFDVWTAFITQDANGRPRLQTDNRSCTIPISVRDNGASASELAYSGTFADHTATDGMMARTREGYVEILVMGEIDPESENFRPQTGGLTNPTNAQRDGSTAWFAKHVNGEPRNCQIVSNDFTRRSALWVPPSAGNAFALNSIPGADAGVGQTGSGSPLARLGSIGNFNNLQPLAVDGVDNESLVGYEEVSSSTPLKVNASLVKAGQGIGAGIESLHLENYGLGLNLVTAQQFPWFLEPSLASDGGLWSTVGLGGAFETTSAIAVENEWTSNPSTGASSEWVVTFPTKRFQADEDARNVQAACSVWRNSGTSDGVPFGTAAASPYTGWPLVASSPRPLAPLDQDDPECPQLGFPTIFQDGNDGQASIVVSYDIYDREEGETTVLVDGPVVSPAPPPEVTIDNFLYEANVVKIGRDVAGLPSALSSEIALSIETNELASNSQVGWMRASFLDAGGDARDYATTGFIFKLRDFGNPPLNFGQATEHGYIRPAP